MRRLCRWRLGGWGTARATTGLRLHQPTLLAGSRRELRTIQLPRVRNYVPLRAPPHAVHLRKEPCATGFSRLLHEAHTGGCCGCWVGFISG